MRLFLRRLFRILFRYLTRMDVAGFENIPKEGGCLLALNHLSVLDAPLIFHLYLFTVENAESAEMTERKNLDSLRSPRSLR